MSREICVENTLKGVVLDFNGLDSIVILAFHPFPVVQTRPSLQKCRSKHVAHKRGVKVGRCVQHDCVQGAARSLRGAPQFRKLAIFCGLLLDKDNSCTASPIRIAYDAEYIFSCPLQKENVRLAGQEIQAISCLPSLPSHACYDCPCLWQVLAKGKTWQRVKLHFQEAMLRTMLASRQSS